VTDALVTDVLLVLRVCGPWGSAHTGKVMRRAAATHVGHVRAPEHEPDRAEAVALPWAAEVRDRVEGRDLARDCRPDRIRSEICARVSRGEEEEGERREDMLSRTSILAHIERPSGAR
jgi:hypothetical protein